MSLAIGLFCVLAGVLWAYMAVEAYRGARSMPRLPPLDAPPAHPPRVRVVVAARDEAERIAGSIRRLLQQRHVDLELILVDDRSSDGTADRAREAANNDPRLRILHVDHLPEGWLGKTHALHLGASGLDRDWLALIDADSWLAPDTLSRAVAFARRESAHHLCLLPSFGPTTLLGRTTLTLFLMSFLRDASRVNHDKPRACVGIGAFNLISRRAHEAVDPLQRLRLEVLDDMTLGRIVRAFGGRSRCAHASRDLEVHWVRSVPGLIRLVEKNQFAVLGFSVPLAALGALLIPSLWFAGVLGWLRYDWMGYLATLGFLLTIPAAYATARLYDWGWPAAILAPIAGMWTGILGAVRSVLITLIRGGVRWRDTTYPLATLRTARKQLVRDLKHARRDTLALPPTPGNSPTLGNREPSRTVEPMLSLEPTSDGSP